MDKLSLAKRIAAIVISDTRDGPFVEDHDMQNLFEPLPPLENMEEAASGASEILPHRTLREKSYGSRPLFIRPDYSGDFLKKLEEPYEGKSLNIEAAEEENLTDFSDPEEKLKHQEQPHPRITVDEYYDINRPGEDAGGQDLKEYWDRGWDETDAPEMSEDKQLRMWKNPERGMKIARKVVASFLRPGVVVASYLMDRFPTILRAPENIKTAKLIADLQKTRVNGHAVDYSGVNVHLIKSSSREGRYVYNTPAVSGVLMRNRQRIKGVGLDGRNVYTTVLQFVPKANIRDLRKLDVQVSCTCPSWLYYGGQYHAITEKYFYGNKVWPKVDFPSVKDPGGNFLVCKHVLKAFEDILHRPPTFYHPNVEKAKKFLKEKDRYQIAIPKGIFKEEVKIPKELVHKSQSPKMKDLIKKWESTPSAQGRARIIKSLTDPEEVAIFGHRFPEDATHLVAKRLKELEFENPRLEKRVQALEKGLEMKEKPSNALAIPAELKFVGDDPVLIDQLSKLDIEKIKAYQAERFVKNLKDPDAVAYLFYKYYDETDPEKMYLSAAAMNEIRDRAEDEALSEDDRDKALKWYKQIW